MQTLSVMALDWIQVILGATQLDSTFPQSLKRSRASKKAEARYVFVRPQSSENPEPKPQSLQQLFQHITMQLLVLISTRKIVVSSISANGVAIASILHRPTSLFTQIRRNVLEHRTFCDLSAIS